MTSMLAAVLMNVGCATPFIRKSMTRSSVHVAGQRRVDLPSAEQSQKLQFNAYTDNNPKGFGLLHWIVISPIIRTLWAGITNAQAVGGTA